MIRNVQHIIGLKKMIQGMHLHELKEEILHGGEKYI